MELSEQIKRGVAKTWPGAALLAELGVVIFFMASLVSVVYGVWLVYEPGAFLVAGAIGVTLTTLYVRGT